MNKLIITLYFAVLLMAAGCSKSSDVGSSTTGTPATTFAAPTWKADDTGKYPATMTAVVALPTALAANTATGDKLAAFVNGECRGVGVIDKVNNQDLYFVLIQGMPDETSKVTFKYYNSKTSFLYEAVSATSFLIDAVYGTAQNPMVLELKQVK